jgi:hypothetical protein
MDVKLLEYLQCDVIPENEEAKRRITEPTLFFMPFCGRQLYNNVLMSNWDSNTLPQVCIIGNGFHFIVSSAISGIKEECLLKVVKNSMVEEITLPEYDTLKDAFNDQAFHFFPKEKLPQESCDAVWSLLSSNDAAPAYDPEVIAR